MITKKVVETWITSDGQEFASELKALEYENADFLMYKVFGQLGNAAAGKTRHKAAMLVLEHLPAIFDHFKDYMPAVPEIQTIDVPVISDVMQPEEPAKMTEVEELDGKTKEILDKFNDEKAGARIHVKKKRKTNPPIPFAKDDILATMDAIKERGVSIRDDIVEVLKKRNMVLDNGQGILKLTSGGYGSMNGLRRMNEKPKQKIAG